MELDLIAIFLLSYFIDFLSLLGTNRICGHPFQTLRCGIGAGIGALYATVCMLPNFSYLTGNLCRIVNLCIISIVVFGLSKGVVRRTIVYWTINMALCGMTLGSDGKRGVEIAIVASVIFVFCLIGYGKIPDYTKFIPVELHYRERRLCITALYDTGNTLSDPVTGMPVLIVDADVAYQLIGLSPNQLKDPIGTMTMKPVPGLRLIPYKTVAASDGMLLGLRLQKVKIGKRMENVLVAFSPVTLSGDGTYQALTGGIR